MSARIALLFVLSVGVVFSGYAQSSDQPDCNGIPTNLNCKVLETFESDTLGGPPAGWRDNRGKDLVPLTQDGVMNEQKNVYVREEKGNHFARIHTDAKALRVLMSRKNGLDWTLEKRPILHWEWRAMRLPEGANEKKKKTNDTGGALYVTFGTDWLGRPKSIKYTYSSTLPTGTTVDYGPLKVLVAASKTEQGVNKWITHERNVVEDYKELFGETPPKAPSAVAMWSDSDTMTETATIDFDDLLFLSAPTHSQSTASSK